MTRSKNQKKTEPVTDETEASERKVESDFEVAEMPNLDLESYIASYKGRARFDRALFIAKHSIALREEALKTALKEAKSGNDVQLYRKVHKLLIGKNLSRLEPVIDQAWIDNTERRNKDRFAQLEAQLKQHQSNLVKESIRLSLTEIGHHHISTGDLQSAIEYFNRVRRHAENDQHLAQCQAGSTLAALYQRNWSAVVSWGNKIRANIRKFEKSQPSEGTLYSQFVHMAEGIAQMQLARYRQSVEAVIQAPAAVGTAWNAFATENDAAVYGGLCALATMDREELQSRVLHGVNFRNYLEVAPYLRRAIGNFCNGRYKECMATLEENRNVYTLDMYLGAHADTLYAMIRKKCIVSYCIPYSSVVLKTLHEALGKRGSTLTQFEGELVEMIRAGELDFSIDAMRGTMDKRIVNEALEIQQDVLKTVVETERELKRRLLHMSIINAGLELKQERKKKGVNASQGAMDGATMGAPPRLGLAGQSGASASGPPAARPDFGDGDMDMDESDGEDEDVVPARLDDLFVN